MRILRHKVFPTPTQPAKTEAHNPKLYKAQINKPLQKMSAHTINSKIRRLRIADYRMHSTKTEP